MNSKQIAKEAVLAAEDKKAVEPVVLNLRRLSDIADYFVIVSGTSDRHVRTIADAVVERLGKKGLKPNHLEGVNGGTWVLADFGDVIVHVFHHETRNYYHLERLWGDAKSPPVSSKHEKRSQKISRSDSA